MRDSNYKSVTTNKAAVTITTSLYDRRALDVTSDKPLVNSLNHLTYLVSSSAKVRETLSQDGGIERLVEILHECHDQIYGSSDNIFNSEKKLLKAWKWTLAFQCLVLIGTRGTENIRQGLVKAGILPVIATVLDNYLTIHERTFAHANSRPLLNNEIQQPTSTRNIADIPPTTMSDSTNSPIVAAPETADGSNSFASFNSNSESVYRNDFQMLDGDLGMNSNFNFPRTVNDIEENFPANEARIPPSFNNRTANMSNFSLNLNHLPSFFKNTSPSNLNCEDYDSLGVDQLLKLVKLNNFSSTDRSCSCYLNSDLRRRYIIVNIIKKLREEKESEILDDRFAEDKDYEMDNNLRFLSDLYLQDTKSTQFTTLINSKISPRNFTDTGVIIPKDDDIVWSLQLLAYISKYPYLKEVLQNTHLLINMSIRDKKLKLYIEKQMRTNLKKSLELDSKSKRFPKNSELELSSTFVEDSATAFETSGMKPSTTNVSNPASIDRNISLDKTESTSCDRELKSDELYSNSINQYNSASDYGDEICDDDDQSLISTECDASEYPNYLSELYDKIIDAESIVDDLDRDLALSKINERTENLITLECKNLSNAIIRKREEQTMFLEEKWDYDSYSNFDIDEENIHKNSDYDESIMEYKMVNLFPMVEKFTFLAGTDMYYWSGVIMRNSCRRNETKGGVRQCGNLECGKWERYPREFSKCRRCKRTKYCSRECQMRAWHCHRNWCIPSSSSSNSTNTTSSVCNQNNRSNDGTNGQVNDDNISQDSHPA
ncbi:Piso0_002066 [Millerozyma farinosa CBS 7064]|uniref:Piso0_002066 protein n=1 Tax=Pichia sorbitophila (strain ATCC MYA-4447 / BCRC 22081 / CBS 7064 / NBRC 10061 / NRRL Y-12695) TaxID=559304 RepID=G8YBL4_PICSO|nr:Piso0_002066 [Millerozyma farinosa CBS 7064]